MGKNDVRELKLLKRILRVSEEGLTYEADPRHAELLARAVGLEDCRTVGTLGEKDKDLPEDPAADGNLPKERTHAEDMQECLNSLVPNLPKTTKINSDEKTAVSM